MITGIISSLIADRVGRRPLFISSFIGNSISLAIVALYFLVVEVLWVNDTIVLRCGWIPIAGIVAFNVISTLGFTALIGMVQAEVFPLNVKAIAMTLLKILDVGLSYGVALAYSKIKKDIGVHGVFWVYVGVSFCAALFTYFIVPETKRESLSEIQDSLQGAQYSEKMSELHDVHSHAETKKSVGLKTKEYTEL